MANVPISAETVGAFVSKFTNNTAKTDVTTSEERAQNVSTYIFVVISMVLMLYVM
jgi:hypothetical protein